MPGERGDGSGAAYGPPRCRRLSLTGSGSRARCGVDHARRPHGQRGPISRRAREHLWLNRSRRVTRPCLARRRPPPRPHAQLIVHTPPGLRRNSRSAATFASAARRRAAAIASRRPPMGRHVGGPRRPWGSLGIFPARGPRAGPSTVLSPRGHGSRCGPLHRGVRASDAVGKQGAGLRPPGGEPRPARHGEPLRGPRRRERGLPFAHK